MKIRAVQQKKDTPAKEFEIKNGTYWTVFT